MTDDIILQVGVKVLLKNKNGKYLLLHRSSEKYKDIKGEWDVPGGRIDPGINLFQNLKREVREETNLNLEKEPKLIAAQDILRIPGRHVVRLTYVGEVEGEPELDKSENDDFKWFSMEDIRNLGEGLDCYLKELVEEGNIL